MELTPQRAAGDRLPPGTGRAQHLAISAPRRGLRWRFSRLPSSSSRLFLLHVSQPCPCPGTMLSPVENIILTFTVYYSRRPSSEDVCEPELLMQR